MRLHPNGSLYVAGLAPGTGHAELCRHFERYGKIAYIFIPRDLLTGRARCFAFLQYYCPGGAGRALVDNVQHIINGRKVYITRPQPGQLERSSMCQYKPLYQRIHRPFGGWRGYRGGGWRGYRVGDICKATIGQLLVYGLVTYISEDGELCWFKQLSVQN